MAFMPSDSNATSVSPSPMPQAACAAGGNADAELAQACRALWLATLSLMTAFMHTQAPAHRYLLARRVTTNFQTLSAQPCFDAGCRATFARLAGKWQHHADKVSPHPVTPRGGLLRALWPAAR
jgi:hypothetical protein